MVRKKSTTKPKATRYTWKAATPADGGLGKKNYAPYSDWWLRLLETPLQRPSRLDFPEPFEFTVSRSSTSRSGGSNSMGGPLPTCHPSWTAPVDPNDNCKDEKGLPPPPQVAPVRSDDVIVAIVDDGIAFANSRFFRVSDDDQHFQTRFKYFWNQDARCDRDGSGNQIAVPFGREWTEEQINQELFNRKDGFYYPDEDQTYRSFEMHDLIRGCATHGTSVLDLATGYDCLSEAENPFGEEQRETAKRRPLIAVQLARIASEESSGAFMATYVTHALSYILKRVIAMQPHSDQPRVPVVINFSYGIIAGGHDGHGLVEEWIDDAVSHLWDCYGIRVSVVLPAGNNLQSKTHGRHEIQSGQSREFTVRLQPFNKASTFVEIWKPPVEFVYSDLNLKKILEQTSRIFVELKPPSENNYVPFNGNFPRFFQTSELCDFDNNLSARLYSEIYITKLNRSIFQYRVKFTIAIAPTHFEEYSFEPHLLLREHSAEAGDWRFKIRSTEETSAANLIIHTWIQRGDTPVGYRKFGRQSYFVDPDYEIYDEFGRHFEDDHGSSGYVKQNGTVNAIGTGNTTIRVGGYRISDIDREQLHHQDENRVASFYCSSAFDGSGDTSSHHVDAGAPSDESHALFGIRASGTHSGSSFRFSGTSISAPQIVRYVAQRYSRDPFWDGTRSDLQSAAKSERKYFFRSNQPKRVGFGLLKKQNI